MKLTNYLVLLTLTLFIKPVMADDSIAWEQLSSQQQQVLDRVKNKWQTLTPQQQNDYKKALQIGRIYRTNSVKLPNKN